MKVTVQGTKEAQRALKKAGADIDAVLREAMEQAAEYVKDEAKRLVPVDSGDLRDAIESRSVDDDNAEVFVITREAHYGHFVEFGTSSQPEQPFMGPAAELGRKELRSIVEQKVREAVGE